MNLISKIGSYAIIGSMRSYYEHLTTALGSGTTIAVTPKPITRSSAIFPVLNLPGIRSRILLMGYWMLKRNISEILAVVTLRSEQGALVSRLSFSIKEPKTLRIELSDQLENAGISPESEFRGSLEVEFFSTTNLVFPYPAVVINYYGDTFSTVVHTAQRVFNDFEDMQRNSQTAVPESGFNIYADEEREPFLALINGPEKKEEGSLKLEFYNSMHEVMKLEIPLAPLNPYETKFVFPAQECDLKSFLQGKVGAGKAHFKLNWIFPRLLVGNIHHRFPALTVTHTYYDTSQVAADSDYWKESSPEWFPASLMVPCLLSNDHYTNVYFYPIYSPSEFVLEVEFYDEAGGLLGKKEEALRLITPEEDFHPLHLQAIAKELHVPTEKPLGVRINALIVTGKRLPARIKLGLDLGTKTVETPCNICTNLQPFNPALEAKPRTFRWGPVLTDQASPMLWIMNSSTHIHYTREAEVEIAFYREKDNSTVARKFTLAPHGFRVLYPNEDPELRLFFEGEIGWFTLVSTNPYTTTYYFAENQSGLIGGDHGF